MMNKTETHASYQQGSVLTWRRRSSPGAGVVGAALLLKPSHDWLFHGGFLLGRELWTDDHSQTVIHPQTTPTAYRRNQNPLRAQVFSQRAKSQLKLLSESARVSKPEQFPASLIPASSARRAA